jgi:toxin ParE1/3/4
LPEAEAELTASVTWYESKRPGMGADLVATVNEALDRISEAPFTMAIWREDLLWRRCALRRFPYVIFFSVRQDEIEVAAFAHGRRRPGYWLARTSL